MNFYKTILKPIFFCLSPEHAHRVAVGLLTASLKIPIINNIIKKTYWLPPKPVQVFGLTFPNNIGLAAGFDKDGKYIAAMSALGFGFLEIGTVTPKPQGGNPTPRLFRLPKDNALINRMGFNNDGADALAERLKKYRQHTHSDTIIGINIGKNKTTPNEQATDDYLYCFNTLFAYADYFVVNVSSPNTPDLRALQEKAPLTALLTALQTANLQHPHQKPILLKIAPDLSDTQLDDILEIVTTTQLAGIIATNTTIARTDLKTSVQELTAIGNGGLSGRPLRQRATAIISYLHQRQPQCCIIGVGGIDSPEAAKEKLQAGATLLQIYSGMIYEGASLIKRIREG
ncbi:MAG: quinone-dependent dihydroorotate dehydrogenase [Saprospiraceae bacterium]|nr:quinone-dependent dihydroorotate dehydrogenase [Saprospiraceae bacterium]MBP7679812.1 quinone-dependent dihydroorotate dehydrogenase [Saprospiraceae bacterium]